MPYLAADAVDLLRALAADVAELKRLLLDSRRGVLAGCDEALVHGVFSVAGLHEVRAGELLAMAQRPGVPEEALRALLGGRSVKAIGKMLADAAGKPTTTGLLLLRRPGRCGATWQVTHARKAANG